MLICFCLKMTNGSQPRGGPDHPGGQDGDGVQALTGVSPPLGTLNSSAPWKLLFASGTEHALGTGLSTP